MINITAWKRANHVSSQLLEVSIDNGIYVVDERLKILEKHTVKPSIVAQN